jgi:hypothetical protein
MIVAFIATAVVAALHCGIVVCIFPEVAAPVD